MARGDVKWFAAFERSSKVGVGFNLASDTIKLGIATNLIVPTVGTDDPRWGTGGSTNLSSVQVTTGSSYTGPITLAGVTYTRTAGVNKLDFDDIVIAVDATGFDNAYYAYLFDDTIAGKYVIAFLDLGGPVSIRTVPLNINVNVAGFLTETAA